ncbi:MAG TPA: carboxypeptidase-like regulatory domain-containing protein [Ignavibacteriaceae bacterium]
MIKYLSIIVIVLSVLTNAQHTTPPAGKIIKGVVVDSVSSSLLPYANITLHNNSDSTFITGASSGVDGEFVLNNLTDGDYYLKISFVGYNTKYISDIQLTKNKQQLDLGNIKLSKPLTSFQKRRLLVKK